ncbi:MAG: response regulator, partial [Candidatus Cloacimonetes bacterium]|nr:response regulator [Candidatus Cloacimonadota bacterium]
SLIMNAGQRAMKLTNQLLAFSRRQVIKDEVLDLNTIIIELISMLRRLLGENIALETHLEENLGHVKLDSSQLEQVLMNLVINAREAMPHGGKISIQTKSMDLDSEYSGSYINLKPGRYSVLSVSDTGIGMNQETQERIFEPFYTTKTTSQGTGLGLATVYGIVNQSGGTIVVYSEPTKGSTFNLFFPCTQEPLAPQTETLRPMNLQGKGELIMVVEDDASLATLIEKMLNKLNYKTFLVRSATDTLSELKNRSLNPDLILTDVMLEDFNGIELAKQVHLQYPDLKVAYMSGYTNTSIIQTGLLKEGTPFLQKPFSQDELGRCVKKVLAKQGAHQSVKALLIDDDENIHILLGRSFSKRNHVLKGAFGLEDALKELEAEKFDLILLDINIPGSDGFSIIYQLRSLGHTLPIIILSGAYMLLDSYMMTELGIVDFVEKSHDHGPLFASIEQYILPNLKE